MLDVALAITAVATSLRLLEPSERYPLAVALALSALNGVVAWLFLRRRAARVHGRWQGAALTVCTLGVAAAAMARAQAPWHVSAQAVFVAGAFLTMVSLGSLGRSFAVLPSLRRVVIRGGYRWVRHPAYASELLMVTAAVSQGDRWAWLLGGLTAVLQYSRARSEERVLCSDEDYRAYAARVPYRFIPRVL